LKLLTSSEEESGNDGAGGSNGQFSGTSKLKSCVCNVGSAGGKGAFGPPDADLIANLGTGIGVNVLELVGCLGLEFGCCGTPSCEGVGGGGWGANLSVNWGVSGNRNIGCVGCHNIVGIVERIFDTFL